MSVQKAKNLSICVLLTGCFDFMLLVWLLNALSSCLELSEWDIIFTSDAMPQQYTQYENLTQIALLVSVTVCLIILIVTATFVYLR